MKNLFFKKAGKIIVFSVALITVFLLNSQQGKSQTTLSIGDIAITGINMDGNDSMSFIVLRSGGVAVNSTIIFTDKGWDGTALSTGEGTVTWTTPAISQYDEFVLQGLTVYKINSDGTRSTSGSCTGTSMSLAIGGDQVFIIQGSTSSPTFLTGAHVNVETSTYPVSGALITTKADWDATNYTSGAGSLSKLSGTGLTTDVNALWLRDTTGTIQASGYWEIDNGRAKCAAMSGSASQIFANLMLPVNWDMDDATAYAPVAPVCSVTSTTWNGTTWSNSAPTSTIDAIIASSTTPGSFTCKNLTINSGVSLTIGSGVTATIYADLTNSGNGTSGVGTLRFAGSTAQAISGTAFTHSGVVEVATSTTLTTNSKLTIANGGSLMHGTSTPNGGGTVSGNVTFEKTIGNTTKGWRMFSIPVNDLIDNFETGLNTLCSNHTPSGERNVYYWDPTNVGLNTAAGWTQANNTTDDETKAYGIYLDNTSHNAWDFSGTVSITGAPNDGSATYNLQYTYDPNSSKTLSQQRGWNFIPNYFPSNLSVYDLINDGNFGSTYKAIHIWDQGTSQMIGLNQSTMNSYNNSSTSRFSTIRQISPFTGFWIKATSTSQSIQLKNSMRTSRTDSLPANTYFKTEPDIFGIEVKDANGNLDRFVVTFIDGAEYGFDEFDLYKFKSFSEDVPTVYTKIAGEEELSYSAMPVAENYSIPVNVESFKDGRAYTVKALKDQYKNYYEVELVDNKTGSKTDLLNNDYTFNFDKNFSAARLTLNFKKKSATSVDELFSNERMYAYTEKGAINVVYNNDNTMANADVEVYNMMGQKLFAKGNVKGGDVVSFAPASNGQVQVYIVKVISNGKAQTIKVVY